MAESSERIVNLDALVREASAALRSPVLHVAPLRGGMSARLFALDLESGRRVVARYPNRNFQSEGDDPVEVELSMLRAVQSAPVPCPKPLGRGTDFLLMSHLPGRATARATHPETFIREMARTLAAIHRTPLVGVGELKKTPPPAPPFWRPMNADLREPEVYAVLARPPAEHPLALRHGDFWPGNFLWIDDKITGVVDWEETQLGPAIADLGISRLDIRWILGREWQEAFTTAYLAENPIAVDDLAYWDLWAASRPMGNLDEWAGPYESLDRPDITPEAMRQELLAFVGEAFDRV